MRKIIAIALALFISSSSGQTGCEKLRQDAAQYASGLLAAMYANPQITAELVATGRARIDSFQSEIAKCD